MVKKIFVILFSILFLTIGLTILPKPEKEDNNMADALQGTWVFNDRLFGGNLELLDIEFIFNFDSTGYHATGIFLSQSTRPDKEIGFMAYDDVGRVYFGDQFDEEDTTSDRWGHESFNLINNCPSRKYALRPVRYFSVTSLHSFIVAPRSSLISKTV